METLKIEITQNEYGSLFASTNNKALLFQFEERGLDDGLGKGKWFFWPHGNFMPVKFTGTFPMTYFLNLCKSLAFILGDKEEMASEVEIVEGENFIK